MKKIPILIISLLTISLECNILAVNASSFVEKPEPNTIYNLSLVSFVSDEELETQDWWLLYAD